MIVKCKDFVVVVVLCLIKTKGNCPKLKGISPETEFQTIKIIHTGEETKWKKGDKKFRTNDPVNLKNNTYVNTNITTKIDY